MRSATVPALRRPLLASLAWAGLGDEVYVSGEAIGDDEVAGANFALRISTVSDMMARENLLVLALICGTRLDLISLAQLHVSDESEEATGPGFRTYRIQTLNILLPRANNTRLAQEFIPSRSDSVLVSLFPLREAGKDPRLQLLC